LDASAFPHAVQAILEAASGSTIIWDFDGVLADTERFHEVSYRIIAEEHCHDLQNGWYQDLVGHTEEHNWSHLIAQGLLATTTYSLDLSELASRREHTFRLAARSRLEPSWLALELMPRLRQVAGRQMVVSNGDLPLIDELLERWGLDELVELVPRPKGTDKRGLVAEHARTNALIFEDTDAYLDLARAQGAFGVGVRHSHNRHARLEADVVLPLRLPGTMTP
jgi:phosphoglycolate phosphatase-like HAD superfamily hydrolase